MKKTIGKQSSPPTRRTNAEPALSDVPSSTSGPRSDDNRSTPTSGRPDQPLERVVVTSFTVLGAHVTWMCAGPFLLVLMLLNIVRTGSGWLTAFDATYFLVVAMMLLGRWVDQRSGQGTTTTGEPATWEDFRRYALLLPPLALGVWILANVVGNHLFAGGAGF